MGAGVTGSGVVPTGGAVVGWSGAAGVTASTRKLRAFMSPRGQYAGRCVMLIAPRPPDEWLTH